MPRHFTETTRPITLPPTLNAVFDVIIFFSFFFLIIGERCASLSKNYY